jgi:hypothetical protein
MAETCVIVDDIRATGKESKQPGFRIREGFDDPEQSQD